MQHILLIILLITSLYSGGPDKVATLDRGLWIDKITDKKSYDRASRYEIISYVNRINSTKIDTPSEIKAFISKDKINLISVEKFKAFTKQNLLNNFYNAQKSCLIGEDFCQKVPNFETLKSLANSYIPSKEQIKWYKDSQRFFSYYLYEQVRLSALSPTITSEIEKIDDREVQGFEYNDGEFLLTFDDGTKYKRTKKVIEILEEKNINGIFFVLGENLEKSIKSKGIQNIKNLYANSCVGSHAYIHKSHQRLKDWKSSYDKTRKLIVDNNLSNSKIIWFRPPYGQRHQKLINHLSNIGDKVMLWNIDSQDWNRKLNKKQIQDRVLTLMLVHRKGILLFHDIHTKAPTIVKELSTYYEKNIFKFLDCRNKL